MGRAASADADDADIDAIVGAEDGAGLRGDGGGRGVLDEGSAIGHCWDSFSVPPYNNGNRMRLLKPLIPLLGIACLASTLDKDDAWVAPRKSYWAFKAPVRAAVPVFEDAAAKAWVKTPVDAFVLEALRAKGLEPSRPLEKAKLLRRVTLDLTGLPPTPEELQAFLQDTKPGAYERVVERLLASPHYAERWATKQAG